MRTFQHTAWGNTDEVALEFGKYKDGSTALELIAVGGEIPEPYMTVSVCFPESCILPPHSFYVKDYSENEGIANWLEENGIASPLPVTVNSGFVRCQAYMLTPEMINEYFPHSAEAYSNASKGC
jgi:hypothetical protein